MLNQVIEQGRITKDLKLQQTSKSELLHFTIAVQRNFKNSQGDYEADFSRCVAFNKTAQFITNHFHKGDQILLSGEWRTGSYQGDDGNTIYTNDLNINQVNFCGGSNKQSKQPSKPSNNSSIDLESLEQNEPPVNKDDLPF